jgi:hypothetical protein
MSLGLAALRQSVDQLAAGQEQMTGDIAPAAPSPDQQQLNSSAEILSRMPCAAVCSLAEGHVVEFGGCQQRSEFALKPAA